MVEGEEQEEEEEVPPLDDIVLLIIQVYFLYVFLSFHVLPTILEPLSCLLIGMLLEQKLTFCFFCS